MRQQPRREPIRMLLVEDNPADARLVTEMLRDAIGSAEMVVVGDGVEAMQYLRAEEPYVARDRPNLLVLDLNLPRKDGREVLRELARDPELSTIPIVVLTTSRDEKDVDYAYSNNANAFVTKPVHIEEFEGAMRAIEAFWLGTASLPA